MSRLNLGPGTAARKVTAILCLIVVGIVLPIVLFRMAMGQTSMGAGIVLIVVATILVAGMIYLLRPVDDEK